MPRAVLGSARRMHQRMRQEVQGEIAMFELKAQFTPADGGAPRPITLRISDVRQDKPDEWSIAVDVLGFHFDTSVRLPKAGDWAEAIEHAARFVAQVVNDKIETEGGGTLEPPIARASPLAPAT